MYELTRASVPWCINTNISVFWGKSAENKLNLHEVTIYLLTRASVLWCINTGILEFSVKNSAENNRQLFKPKIFKKKKNGRF